MFVQKHGPTAFEYSNVVLFQADNRMMMALIQNLCSLFQGYIIIMENHQAYLAIKALQLFTQKYILTHTKSISAASWLIGQLT